MQVNVHVDAETTSVQFVALANFFTELSGVPAAVRVQPPSDPANLDEPEIVVIPETTTTTTTKRRRTKAEIAADEAAAKVAAAEAEAKAQEEAISGEGSVVAEAEAAAQSSNEAALAEIKAAEAATVVVDDFEKVAGGKTYTEAEAQQLATVIARTKGPQVVKDKIAALGATRIGDLTADQLNELGNFLEAQK